MKPTKKNIDLMLRESNAIENVYDQKSFHLAKKAWEYLMIFDTINGQIIRQAHKLLMQNQDVEYKHKGHWRTVPVWIGGKKKSDLPPAIEKKIRAWCTKTLTVDRNYDPVSLHVEFENIHPFVDGNGRIGRMLLNWHLLKLNKAPLVVYTKADVKTYYRLFDSYRAKEFAATLDAVMKFAEQDLK